MSLGRLAVSDGGVVTSIGFRLSSVWLSVHRQSDLFQIEIEFMRFVY